MTNVTFADDPVATELRRLADEVPAVPPPPALAADVLRLARRHPRRRTQLVIGVALLVVGASIAATLPGRNPHFAITEPSGSMEPVVAVGERVVFDRELEPQRGDVVYAQAGGHEAIRRVAAVAGDTVACPVATGGDCAGLEVNGEVVAEDYLGAAAMKPFEATEVAPGAFFLLGDNRGNAIDSRHYGPVGRSDIRGVGVAILGTDGTSRPVPGAPPRTYEDGLVDPPPPVPPAGSAPAS